MHNFIVETKNWGIYELPTRINKIISSHLHESFHNNNLVVKKVNMLNSIWRIQQLGTEAENSNKLFQDNTWSYI